ncbi:SpoIIE family protein phosphatase [Streptomyces spororaveus]|uniref:Transcription antitermination regulator n=1 Tax=Streptomyces spororaveus TaxID=284039 RepID=A0ABQ3TQ26_9ACTN|nr:SpoIIE family protein phosphatase [Streptomyces spororaveus]GHI82506.1 transcription antitermination regulator [Streptomyces spororaveus]
MDEPADGPATQPPGDPDGLRRAVRALTAEIAELQAERADRHLLDLATGILVAQLSAPPSAAAGHLSRLAASTRVSAPDVAADIVNAAAGITVAEGRRAPARRLRRTDAAVGAATYAGQAATALLESGLSHLGVQAVWLWRRTATDCLELVAHAGGSALQAVHWQWLPAHMDGPLRTALDTGEPGWLPGGPPPGQPLPGAAPDTGRAVLPLRDQGAVVGALLAAWPGPVAFDPPMRRAVEAVADSAARIVDAAPDPDGSGSPLTLRVLLDCVADAVLLLSRTGGPAAGEWVVGHANPAAARQLGGLPKPVGRSLGEVLPVYSTDLLRLVDEARTAAAPRRVDRLADKGAGALTDVRALPLGPERAVVLWHTSDDPGLMLPQVLGRLDHLALFEDDLVTGVSEWSERAYSIFGMQRGAPGVPLRDLLSRTHRDDKGQLAALLESLTVRQEGAHALIRIVRDDGGMRHVRISAEPLLKGAVTVAVTGVFQDVSAQHRTELALGATYDELTAAHAQAAVRHQFVLQLQQAILPEVPESVRLPGLLVTARYRPAAQEYRVGGDWYDLLPLPDGRVMLAVGDIAGHGLRAATAMVAVRNALRGLAFTGASAGQLMGWLNAVASADPQHSTATAVCAHYEPREGVLRWSSAGHLPLILLREGRAVLLETPRDLLLGAVKAVEYTETVTPLRPGDLLVLYTDGLVERRHRSLDHGVERLRRAVEGAERPGLDEMADLLLAEVRGDTDDDTSLVLLRVLPQP